MSFLKIQKCTDRQLLSILKTINNTLITTTGFHGGYLLRQGYEITHNANIEAMSDSKRIGIFNRPGDEILDGLSNKDILSLYKNLFANACDAMSKSYAGIAEKYAKRISLINALVQVEPAKIDDYDVSNSPASNAGVYISKDFEFSSEKTWHDVASEAVPAQSALFKATKEETSISSFERTHKKLLNLVRNPDGQYAEGKTRALWNSFNIGIHHADQCREQQLTLAHQNALEAEHEIEYQTRYLMSINAEPLEPKDIAEIRESWGLRHIPEGFAGLRDIASKWINDINPFEDEGLYESNIKSVILVGSHAKGKAKKDSDFDVAIIYSSSIRKENDLPSSLKLSEALHSAYGPQMPLYCGRPIDIQIFFDDDKELTSYSTIALKPGAAYQFYDDDLDQLPPIVIAHKLGADEIKFKNMGRYHKNMDPMSEKEMESVFNKLILETKSGAQLPIKESTKGIDAILKKHGIKP